MSASRDPSTSGAGFEPTEVGSTPKPDDLDDHPTAVMELPRISELAAGVMVGEYRVETLIGAGGMGEVFSAVHPLIGKRAAIKVLRQELCRDRASVERFIDEARVVNQIGHTNIVDVFAFGQLADGRHYFVMEWLKGESLRSRLARGRLSLPELCTHVRPLARALMAAHAKGIVHRDLKPDNIFLEDVGEELPVIKLLDFGIAKLAHTEHRMEQTASGAVLGTPQYIAPEQAKGIAVDHRADIYALGGIVYEMVSGQLPFIAASAMEVIALHLMQPPTRASAITPVPSELDDLVLAMLAKDPAARPSLATVCDVIDRVKRAPMPVRVEPADTSVGTIATVAPTMTRRAPPRSRIAVAAVIVALFGAVLAFTVGRVLTRSSPPPPPAPAAPAAPIVTPITPPAAPVATPRVVTPAPPDEPLFAPPPDAAPATKPTPTILKKPRPHHDVPRPRPAAGSDQGELLFEPGTLGKP